MNQQERRQRAKELARLRDCSTGCEDCVNERADAIESALFDAYDAGRREALREAADAAASALHPVEGMVSVHDVNYWLRDRASTLDPTTREGQE